MREPKQLDELFEDMPDRVRLIVQMDKEVWREMYKRTQSEENGIVDERHVLNDWVIGAIRHEQAGVYFLYENGATEGIPSVRFTDEYGTIFPPQAYPYPNSRVTNKKENENEHSTTD